MDAECAPRLTYNAILFLTLVQVTVGVRVRPFSAADKERGETEPAVSRPSHPTLSSLCLLRDQK